MIALSRKRDSRKVDELLDQLYTMAMRGNVPAAVLPR